MSRPSWPETFHALAAVLARRATCPRLAVGAVIYNDDYQILSTGFNGAPRGLPHCTGVGCEIVDGHCVRAVHAELNAILQAARVGVSVKGAHLVLTHTPCVRCALAIVQVGLVSVSCATAYVGDERDLGRRTLRAAGIGVSTRHEPGRCEK